MKNSSTISPRIEFIDSLKGFLILSVVMCHVGGFCMGIQEDIPSLHFLLFEFRNPPFFFISGFFAYKVGTEWNMKFSFSIIRKKTFMIFWPTTIFLLVLLYVHPSFQGRTFLHDDLKDIWFHWFTYALFLFFVIYTCLRYLLYKTQSNSIVEDLVIAGCGILFYLLFSVPSIYERLPLSEEWKDGLGLQHWGYFLFFVIGTLAKKHIDHFFKLLESHIFITICLMLFVILNIFWTPMMEHHFNLFRITTFLSGIILVFSFFRNYTLPSWMRNFFLLTGRRTLDIYLIHYFFLPLALYTPTAFLRETPMPIIEFFITISISLLVIGMSLLVSKILRMTTLSTYLLFGEKQNK